jgi:hypothetical protein
MSELVYGTPAPIGALTARRARIVRALVSRHGRVVVAAASLGPNRCRPRAVEQLRARRRGAGAGRPSSVGKSAVAPRRSGTRSRRVGLVELLFVLWAAVWAALAVQVALEVRGLRELSSTVQKTGAAVRASGEALERLTALPVVGGELEEPALRIRRAGESAVASGRSRQQSIHDLSVLLAVAIAVPSVAVLGLLLQVRRSQVAQLAYDQ